MKKIFIVQLLALVFVVNCCNATEYKVEKYPASSSVSLHTKHYLGERQEVFKYSDTSKCSIVSNLFKVDGVGKIISKDYEIDVEIGKAFDFDEIIIKLEQVVKNQNCALEHKKGKLYAESLEPDFYNYKVWDVVAGEGTVIGINSNPCVPYPISVKFGNGIIKLYTRDGKDNANDLIPSLYPYKVKIVKE
jgi:hypothetical protein